MIYCIGDANWDLLVQTGKLPRMETQQITKFTWVPGGEAQNTARRIWELGKKVKLVARIGSDPLGLALKEITPFADFSLDNSSPTGLTLAFLSKGKRGFITDRGANENLDWRQVRKPDIEKASFIFKGGYWHNERFRRQRGDEKLFKLAKNLEKPTGLNLGWNYTGWTEKKRERLFRVIELADFLFLNDREAKDITGERRIDRALNMLKEYTSIVLHLGERGCRFVSKDLDFKVKTKPVIPRNPVGAGDAFNAGFIVEWLESHDAIRACKAGNLLAGKYISKPPNRFLPKIKF